MVELLAGQRHKGETSKAVQACNDYLRMGPGRSLRLLARNYNELERRLTPTHSFATLGRWSGRYGWQSRAEQYDTELEARKNAEAEAVMQEGLGLAHERVRMLKELAQDLKPLVLRTVTRKEVEVQVANTATVAQLRGALDDLAKETGGRIKIQEITGKGGGPLQTEDVNDTRQRLLEDLQSRLEAADAAPAA